MSVIGPCLAADTAMKASQDTAAAAASASIA